ncbi:hypothetical protein MAR_009530 [Mya arenaria]|uniref:Uncharacterized protein n=1 Tax=Mya arenaria TaxID=6604 RepID=A0ABY7E1Z7_MYAAR|nr:hypothetical protein MAR_009530 [Mya arenaria]
MNCTDFGRSTELNMYESIQGHPSDMYESVDTSSPPQMVSKTRCAVESDYTLPRPDVTSTNDVIHGHVNAAIIKKDASILHETFDGSRMPKYRAPDVPSSDNDVGSSSSESSDAENVEMGDSGKIASVKRKPPYVIPTVCEIDKDRPPTLPDK